MTHTNYHEIQADSYYDLGLKKGQLFKRPLVEAVAANQKLDSWKFKLKESEEYLKYTQDSFPQYVEELKGYAAGAGVSFEDLWVLSLEDELSEPVGKCTTVITNNGKLIAHNEDWEADWKNMVCILRQSIRNRVVFELFYYNTLGGNSISINSFGCVQAINSLTHKDRQIGVPHNVVARWLSEVGSPQADFDKLSALRRSSGYSHNLINRHGEAWSIESSAKEQSLLRIAFPFIHTNHFLTDLKKYENNDNSTGTFDRYDYAAENVKERMSLSELQNMMSDDSKGRVISLFNERTIARMIVDLEKYIAYVWLLREPDKGWVEYDLDFLWSG